LTSFSGRFGICESYEGLGQAVARMTQLRKLSLAVECDLIDRKRTRLTSHFKHVGQTLVNLNQLEELHLKVNFFVEGPPGYKEDKSHCVVSAPACLPAAIEALSALRCQHTLRVLTFPFVFSKEVAAQVLKCAPYLRRLLLPQCRLRHHAAVMLMAQYLQAARSVRCVQLQVRCSSAHVVRIAWIAMPVCGVCTIRDMIHTPMKMKTT
jgi:hypothetical protein